MRPFYTNIFYKCFILFFTFFQLQTTAQIKLSKTEIKNVKVKHIENNDVVKFFFTLNGKKIGPSLEFNKGIHATYYDKKGRKTGAEIFISNDSYFSIDIYKKGKKDGNGFAIRQQKLVYAKTYADNTEYDLSKAYNNKKATINRCIGQCDYGFGYKLFEDSKINLFGFFDNFYPDGAVFTLSPRDSYYGYFKKGRRNGNGILKTKKTQEIRHASFRRGYMAGLELYINPKTESYRAFYRDRKGYLVKEYKIERNNLADLLNEN